MPCEAEDGEGEGVDYRGGANFWSAHDDYYLIAVVIRLWATAVWKSMGDGGGLFLRNVTLRVPRVIL